MSRQNIVLSCTLATFNEEENIERCLESVKEWVDEIVVVDGGSTDGTVEIAKKHGAKVEVRENPKMFHINKNKANELAQGEWILQLDADEVVSEELGKEIRELVQGQSTVMLNSFQHPRKYPAGPETRFAARRASSGRQNKVELFERHRRVMEMRHGKIGTDEGEVVAYFVPRRNYFLGRLLKYGGMYPDGAVRLFKKGFAKLPEKDLHEIYEIKGRVGWLNGDLLHYDSPTFERYLERNNRYSSRFAEEMKAKGVKVNLINSLYYMIWKPKITFLMIYFRHKGFLDGFPGLVWAVYSALTWVGAWVKLWEKDRNSGARSQNSE